MLEWPGERQVPFTLSEEEIPWPDLVLAREGIDHVKCIGCFCELMPLRFIKNVKTRLIFIHAFVLSPESILQTLLLLDLEG